MEFSICPFFTQLVPRKYLQHRFGLAGHELRRGAIGYHVHPKKWIVIPRERVYYVVSSFIGSTFVRRVSEVRPCPALYYVLCTLQYHCAQSATKQFHKRTQKNGILLKCRLTKGGKTINIPPHTWYKKVPHIPRKPKKCRSGEFPLHSCL